MQTNLFEIVEKKIETIDKSNIDKNKNIEKRGISKFRNYIFWHDSKMVYDYVYNFLAEKFSNPSDLIVHNINRINIKATKYP